VKIETGVPGGKALRANKLSFATRCNERARQVESVGDRAQLMAIHDRVSRTVAAGGFAVQEGFFIAW
jgi:hypothetical protein